MTNKYELFTENINNKSDKIKYKYVIARYHRACDKTETRLSGFPSSRVRVGVEETGAMPQITC